MMHLGHCYICNMTDFLLPCLDTTGQNRPEIPFQHKGLRREALVSASMTNAKGTFSIVRSKKYRNTILEIPCMSNIYFASVRSRDELKRVLSVLVEFQEVRLTVAFIIDDLRSIYQVILKKYFI